MITYSKAQTLVNLQSLVEQFEVPHIFFFKATDWIDNKKSVLDDINNSFSSLNNAHEMHLAVRSSAADEDGKYNAKAGEYDSVLNVPLYDQDSLTQAVQKVIFSFVRKREILSNDEIIIQKMIENPIMSGVVFTKDLNSGAPYYVINYDDVTGKTDTVTGGGSEYSNRTLYVLRSAIKNVRSERFKALLSAIEELEDILDYDCLDIEFAMDQNLKPYLLQVRPITTSSTWDPDIEMKLNKSLEDIHSFVSKRFKPMDGVFGETTVLGQMPDWNPVEMIGRSPKQLSYSIYEKLITKDAWRIARERMGYLTPEGKPLMIDLGGQPYIDTRLSFHSYLPGGLPSRISEKLVNKWVKNLSKNPHLHDKIEFEVAITIYSFDIDEKLKSLVGEELSVEEKKTYKECIRAHSVELIEGKNDGSIYNAMERIDFLSNKQKTYQELIESTNLEHLPKLIEDCINYGTIPFSILARHGFIAKTLLGSIEKNKILTKQEVSNLENSIETIAGELVNDLDKCANSKISKNNFMKKYGHLRPGTYDIQSPRYDQMVGFFSSIEPAKESIGNLKKFDFSESQKIAINNLFKSIGSEFDSDKFYEYVKKAIAGREYGKFIFTKSISTILELISKFGEQNGLSREDLSYIDIDDILSLNKSTINEEEKKSLVSIIDFNRSKNILGSTIRLPQILFDTAGVYVVPFQVAQPNFITLKSATLDAVFLKTREYKINLKNKIVLIDSADPGFDWIFGKSIGGLITKYGGANSHMAIRCAEFGIPAAIGCGEQRFETLKKAKKITIDCSSAILQKYE